MLSGGKYCCGRQWGALESKGWEPLAYTKDSLTTRPRVTVLRSVISRLRGLAMQSAWGLRARCTLGSPFSTRPSWCDQEVSAALLEIVKILPLNVLRRIRALYFESVDLDLSPLCVQVGQIGLIRKNGGRKENGEWSAMLRVLENFTWSSLQAWFYKN